MNRDFSTLSKIEQKIKRKKLRIISDAMKLAIVKGQHVIK